MSRNNAGDELMKYQLIGMCLCLSFSLMSFAQDPSKIIAMENAWNHAEMQKDAGAVQLLLADDFVMTTADGTLYNKAQMVASVRDASYKPDALQSSEMTVHSLGTT